MVGSSFGTLVKGVSGMGCFLLMSFLLSGFKERQKAFSLSSPWWRTAFSCLLRPRNRNPAPRRSLRCNLGVHLRDDPSIRGYLLRPGSLQPFHGCLIRTLLLCLGQPNVEALLRRADEALPVGYGLCLQGAGTLPLHNGDS